MPSYNTVFESKEEIYGIVPRADDSVHYSALLQIKDSGKFPVVLEMKFVPPHPFAFNMPEKHIIRATSISDAYAKVAKFFYKYGIRFR
ncbi:MAG: hypothetical protein KKF30_14010 [Proteobacteria bacterium]|nr:hypothetical protein [Desulfobacteraceae bacterium]MBU4056137.1 hypothetical protein [Pseudomonadota bacterium]MBU4318372.1 hypothetical protein [Pseudomonadota bacterium]MBU4471082.1 hypothetical protein [Pseudomonadota bacterium]MCG2753680.1 hypothetical protein [Desulfobacteraceae bacterium]